MIDDFESNMQTENIESTSNKFQISQSDLPGDQQDINILSMSTSKKYLYLLTEKGEILCIESKTLKPFQQSFSIRPNSKSFNNFKENFNKIWTDRSGNHNIIRFSGKIFTKTYINPARTIQSRKFRWSRRKNCKQNWNH